MVLPARIRALFAPSRDTIRFFGRHSQNSERREVGLTIKLPRHQK
ncbi:hypothetical protein CEXT_319681, partial [Caerostris extrusa]